MQHQQFVDEYAFVGSLRVSRSVTRHCMNSRQSVYLSIAIVFLLGSLLPKAIIEKAANRPFDKLWWVRLCLASMGVIMILTLRTVKVSRFPS